MWFLVLQILILLILAALCGALLTYWWMKNRYEDVTESYGELVQFSDRLKDAPVPATLTDLEKSRSDLVDQISRIPQTDLTSLESRLTRIEEGLQPISSIDSGHGVLGERLQALEIAVAQLAETPPAALNERLSGIESFLHKTTAESSSATEARFGGVEAMVQRLAEETATSTDARLGRIEEQLRNISIPEVDLAPLHSGIAALDLAVSDIDLPVTDLDPLRQHLNAMEARLAEFAERLDTQRKSDSEALTIRLQTFSSALAGLRMPDIDAVRDRLSRIESALAESRPEAPDFSPLLNKLADLEGGSAALHSKLVNLQHRVMEQGEYRVDLSPVQNRLGALESALSAVRVDLQGMPDIAPVERRLSALQETVLANRENEFTPVLSSVRKMETRLNSVALEDRLASIEYNLAALQHLLRARHLSDQSYQTTVYETRAEVPAWFTDSEPPKPETTEIVTETVTTETRQPVAPDPKDPIAHARRPDDEANLLTEAAFGQGDDLERIIGVGPMLGELLNDVGVFYFWQVAEWSDADVAWVDSKLEHFKGRIERDKWVAQARHLAREEGTANRPVASAIS